MNTRVVMVHPVAGATVSYSHGLASLAAVLLSEDNRPSEVHLIVARDDDLEATAKSILGVYPDVILVSTMSNQWHRVKHLATLLKTHAPAIPLCVGGTHVTAAPQSVSDSAFDIGVPGEAEDVISPLVLGGSTTTEAIAARLQLLQSHRKVVANLDQLPMPYLELFPRSDILAYPSVMFSRGCPYECTYCMSRKGGDSGHIRWKSPERALAEVKQLISLAAPDEINIDDDTFLKNPRWVRTFCRLYRDSVDVPFCCNARPETVTAELAECLRGAGCSAMGIGIESGSERIRRDVLQRRMSDEVIVRAFDAAHTAGLRTWSFNMVGLPGETSDDLKATIELNERVKTDFIRVSIFTPYPGTPIFSSSTARYDRGYIRAPRDLPGPLYSIYSGWIARLEQQGRLWFTQSETDLLVDHGPQEVAPP